jgi:hypothetical protein
VVVGVVVGASSISAGIFSSVSSCSFVSLSSCRDWTLPLDHDLLDGTSVGTGTGNEPDGFSSISLSETLCSLVRMNGGEHQ